MFGKLMKMAMVVAAVGMSGSAIAAGDRRPSFTPREVAGVININAASAKELELLPGVGHKTAGLIVAYREKTPFKAPHDIVKVKGVGERTFNKIKPYLAISGPTTLAVPSHAKASGNTPQPEKEAPATNAE